MGPPSILPSQGPEEAPSPPVRASSLPSRQSTSCVGPSSAQRGGSYGGEPKLGCLIADLCFGKADEGGNGGDCAPVLDPVLKREQLLFGPLFDGVEIRLFGHAIHPNSRALSLAS